MIKKVALIATLSLIFSASFVHAYVSPGKPQGFVSDFAGVLSVDAKSQLEQKLSDFSKQTTIEIAVVTIPALVDETIESYTVKLFEEWGIGDKEKDNGALFLIAPNDRVVRIEVGYGLEGVLTDAQSNGIIQKIVIPEFKNGNLEVGIVKGTDAIVSVVKTEADYSTVSEPEAGFNWEIIVYFIIFGFIWLVSILSRSKSWWLGGVLGGIAGIILGFIFGFIFTGIISVVGLTLLGLLFDFIVSKAYSKSMKDGGHPPWWIGGGGLGGHSGGGFGGFGGGMSGGGGSSGRW